MDVKKQTGDAAKRMLSELEGLPLSMARKLDPCELYELLFGNSYVNYEEAPNGTQEKRVHFGIYNHFDFCGFFVSLSG